MFKSKIILLFILINISLFSQDFPLNYERLSVDFNGITYNGKSIICYGTGGIILRSSDFGENWTQKQIAHDVYTVTKIVHHENSYYGILDSNYFVYSENDGLNWEKIKFEDALDFIDINSDSDGIYLLTENEILLIDFKFNILYRKSIANPDTLQRFINSNKYLILCDSKNKLNIFEKKNLSLTQTIDLSEFLNDAVSSGLLKFIKDGKDIYLKAGKYIIKSSDEGFTWEKMLSDTSIYTVNDGKIYFLNSEAIKSDNISSLRFQTYEIGSLRDICKYKSESYVSRQVYSEMKFLNEDTLIAVGLDKLINISYDGGRNWKLLSNLRIVNLVASYWLNENTGYLYTTKFQIFRTANDGTTWLPQVYNYQYKGSKTFTIPDAWYFDGDGTHFLFREVLYKNSDNILVSKDGGKSYETKYDSVSYGYLDGNFPPNIVKNDSNYLLVMCISDIGSRRLTLMVEYDKDINAVKKWLIDSMSILFAFQSEDKKKLIGIGLEQTYTNHDTLCQISSIDGGKTWSNDFKFFIKYDFINNISLLDDIIIFRSYVRDSLHKGSVFARVDFLDFKQKKLQPLVMNDTFVIYIIFPLENTLFATSYQGKIFSNPEYETNFYNWISHDMTLLKTLSPQFSNNKVAYGPGSYNIKNNLYKFTKNKINYVEDTEIDVPSVYFFTMKPYPLPAKDIIKCHIFTTMDFNPMEPDVFVYDLFGKKVNTQGDIFMSRFSNWEWDLQWDCSKIPSGIYIIVLKEGSISRSIRVVVGR